MVGWLGLSLDDWRSVATIAGSALAAVLGIWRVVVARRPQVQLAVHEEETKLIDNLQAAIPNFEASYNNNPINDMAVSKFFIWNSGTEALRRENVAPLDPIRIQFASSARILECTILRTTAPAINFAATVKNARTVELSFDYLNKKDGALVQVLFTGAPGDDTEVNGQLIGIRPSIKYTGDESYRIHGYRGGGNMLLLSASWQTAGAVFNFLIGSFLVVAFWLEWQLPGFLVGLAFALLAIWSWVPSRNEIPKPLREDLKT